MLEKVSNKRLTRVTGRRPKVLANGTHHRLDAPSMMRLTAMRYVSSENGLGGRPKIGVDAYMGSALPMEELAKLTIKG